MKSKVLLMALVLISPTAFTADLSGAYQKQNGVVEVQQQGNQVAFSINSSVDMHACNLGEDDQPLVARMLDATRAAWTSEEMSDRCVVVLNFAGGQLKVTTKDCDSYCGMDAVGSMDGTYHRENRAGH